jgi:hypothetical protein
MRFIRNGRYVAAALLASLACSSPKSAKPPSDGGANDGAISRCGPDDGDPCTVEVCSSAGVVSHEASSWLGCPEAVALTRSESCSFAVTDANRTAVDQCGARLADAAEATRSSTVLDAAWRDYLTCLETAAGCPPAAFAEPPNADTPLALGPEICKAGMQDKCVAAARTNMYSAIALCSLSVLVPVMYGPAGCVTAALVNEIRELMLCDNANSCLSNESCCSESCVKPLSDQMNCGLCGMACGSGFSCSGGICKCGIAATCSDPSMIDLVACTCSTCPRNQAHCGGTCIDIVTDKNNCGTCGHGCLPSETCIDGACDAGMHECRNKDGDFVGNCHGTSHCCAAANSPEARCCLANEQCVPAGSPNNGSICVAPPSP